MKPGADLLSPIRFALTDGRSFHLPWTERVQEVAARIAEAAPAKDFNTWLFAKAGEAREIVRLASCVSMPARLLRGTDEPRTAFTDSLTLRDVLTIAYAVAELHRGAPVKQALIAYSKSRRRLRNVAASDHYTVQAVRQNPDLLTAHL